MADPTTPPLTAPTLGRIVIYTSRNGDGVQSPAMVLRTRATTNLDIIERWGPSPDGTLSGKGRPTDLVPELDSDFHVDLLVHGLGGDYREFNVPHPSVAARSYPADTARTWDWPARV